MAHSVSCYLFIYSADLKLFEKQLKAYVRILCNSRSINKNTRFFSGSCFFWIIDVLFIAYNMDFSDLFYQSEYIFLAG